MLQAGSGNNDDHSRVEFAAAGLQEELLRVGSDDLLPNDINNSANEILMRFYPDSL